MACTSSHDAGDSMNRFATAVEHRGMSAFAPIDHAAAAADG
jgi:hypothetical protein